jgi:hypothetical protein
MQTARPISVIKHPSDTPSRRSPKDKKSIKSEDLDTAKDGRPLKNRKKRGASEVRLAVHAVILQYSCTNTAKCCVLQYWAVLALNVRHYSPHLCSTLPVSILPHVGQFPCISPIAVL